MASSVKVLAPKDTLNTGKARNLHGYGLFILVIQEGFEPPTHGLEEALVNLTVFRLSRTIKT